MLARLLAPISMEIDVEDSSGESDVRYPFRRPILTMTLFPSIGF